MKTKYQSINNLKISENLLSFVNDELLKQTQISPDKFWHGFDEAVHELAPLNKKLIDKREELQKKIDEWHIKKKGNKIEITRYLFKSKKRSLIQKATVKKALNLVLRATK